MKTVARLSAIFVITLAGQSCGGGGGTSGDGAPSHNPSPAPAQPAEPMPGSSPPPDQGGSVDPNIARYYKDPYHREGWGGSIQVQFSGFQVSGLKYYNSDGTFGLTEIGQDSSSSHAFTARQRVTAHFHLGSIEFHSVANSNQLSIFHLLRTHNHRSDEVINLTRLLMLLDENNATSKYISLPETAHDAVATSGLVLEDLSIDIDDFESNEKVNRLLARVGVSQLPSIRDSENYINEHFNKWLNGDYSQWPAGYEIDFDRDGVVNENDAFPWDATQWLDEDNDRVGDASPVVDIFLDTNGVLQYEVDALHGYLYVAGYDKKLSKFNIETGEKISSFEFNNYITNVTVSDSTGDVYVGLTSEYIYNEYVTLADQNGSIALIRPNSDRIDKTIDIGAYPVSLKVGGNGFLFVSCLNEEFWLARLLKIKPSLDDDPEVLNYPGGGGRISLGDTKMVVSHLGGYVVVDQLEDFRYLASGTFHEFYIDALLVLQDRDVVVDSFGLGFKLSPLNGETFIFDRGVEYIDVGYYIGNLKAWILIQDLVKNENTNQYVASTGHELFYVNADTLMIRRAIGINNYVSGSWDAKNNHQYKIAVVGGKLYAITDRNDGVTHIAIVDDQCMACGESNPPVAVISDLSTISSIQSPIVFDASSSYDREDGSSLLFRWDFNGDGKWDTEFVDQKQYAVKYELSGEKRVVLQAMDYSGLVGEDEVILDLEYGINSGYTPKSEELIDIPLTIDDVAFDRVRDAIYVSSSETNRFYVLDSLTGKVTKEFEFRYLPTHIDIDDDGDFLYLGLRSIECQQSLVDCEDDLISANDGLVLKFDLETQAFIDSMFVDVSPADIKTNSNKLYVSANSLFNHLEDFDSRVAVYDLGSKAKLRNLGVGDGNFAQYTRMLSITDGSSGEDCDDNVVGIFKYCDSDIDVLHDVANMHSLPSHWLLPNKPLALNNTGLIVNTVEFREQGKLQRETPSGYSISNVSADLDRDILLVGYADVSYSGGGFIRYYDYSNFQLLGEEARDGWPYWLFSKNGKVIEIERRDEYRYKLNISDYPCYLDESAAASSCAME